MSYDIFCYKSNLGRPYIKEASKVIEDDNDIWVKKPYNYETKITIEKALLDFDSKLKGFDYDNLAKKKNKSVTDVKKEFQKLELNTAVGEAEIYIEIFDYHVAIKIPYLYHGDIAKNIFDELKSQIKIINETAGYFVYDPQTGEAFNSINNNFDGLRKYLSVSENIDDIFKSSAQTKGKKPWWKF